MVFAVGDSAVLTDALTINGVDATATFAGKLQFDTAQTFTATAGTAKIQKHASNGLLMTSVVGSNNDFQLVTPAGGNIMLVPTGTDDVTFAGNIDAVAGGINLGATGSANLLDDYEEGTWTPTIQDSSFSDAEGQTYSFQVGRYTKIGNTVHLQGRVTMTSLGTMSGGLSLAGFPFATSGTANNYSGGSIGQASGLSVTAGQSLTLRTRGTSQTQAFINIFDGTAGTSTLTTTQASATLELMFGLTYQTDA